MLTQENLIVFLYALPVYQLLFYTVQLITFRRAYPSRKYLGFLLLTMTVVLVINAIHYFGYEQLMSVLYIFFTPLLLSLIPIFHLYLSSLVNGHQQTGSLSRFSPFIIPAIGFLLSLFTFGMFTLNERLMIMAGIDPQGGGTGAFAVAAWVYKWIIPVLLVVQLIMGLTKARHLFRSEREAVRKDPGRFAYLQVRWISVMAVSLILFVLVIVLPFLIPVANQMNISLITNAFLLITGGVIGFYGMKQDTLLMQVSSVSGAGPANLPSIEAPPPEIDTEPVSDSSPAIPIVSEVEARRIINRLKTLMETKKPYMDARYSLNELCTQMETSRRIMTYVLNDVMGKNFYGVVNEYRLRDAIQIMEDSGRKYTIEAIAEMVGFNSKSSFYACFKKFTGMSPKEYFESK